MPGPRNSKRQKKLDVLKGKKRKGSQTSKTEAEPVATPQFGENVTPLTNVEEKRTDVTADVERRVEVDEQEEILPAEPPAYDAGTGPRVRSMGKFLQSSFASEPTWDDELCAEFAQEEMLEMLREVLPEEMALVSSELLIMGSFLSVGLKVGGNE